MQTNPAFEQKSSESRVRR